MQLNILQYVGTRHATQALGLVALCAVSVCPGVAQFNSSSHHCEGHPPVVKDLGVLPGFLESRAYGINNRGDVVGISSIEGRDDFDHAFLYKKGELISLGTLPTAEYSHALAVNESDVIVGDSEVLLEGNIIGFHAVVWDHGVIADLGTLGTYTLGGVAPASIANAINNHGQIVGESGWILPEINSTAFLYEDGTMRSLGFLPGGGTSIAYGIDDQGEIVGSSASSLGTRAFLYKNGVMHDLGTLPGGSSSAAYGINNRGQIVGTSTVANGESHAFLYEHGKMIDLTTFPGGEGFSSALSISDDGKIVGPDYVFDHGKVTNISDPDATGEASFFREASINNAGEVVGEVATTTGSHAGLLDIDRCKKDHKDHDDR